MECKLLPKRFVREPDGTIVKLLEGGDDEARWSESGDFETIEALRDLPTVLITEYEGQEEEPGFDWDAPEHTWESLPEFAFLSQYSHYYRDDDPEAPFPVVAVNESGRELLGIDFLGVRRKSSAALHRRLSEFGLSEREFFQRKIPPIQNEDPDILRELAQNLAKRFGTSKVSLIRYACVFGPGADFYSFVGFVGDPAIFEF